jgi:hypothetical protein
VVKSRFLFRGEIPPPPWDSWLGRGAERALPEGIRGKRKLSSVSKPSVTEVSKKASKSLFLNVLAATY